MAHIRSGTVTTDPGEARPMARYADSEHCPDCGAMLVPGRAECPACLLPLGGPAASELFATLTRADSLVAALRAERDAVRLAEPSAPGVPAEPLVPGMPGTPGTPGTPGEPAKPPVHLTVPAVLLGLGALCVIVAAVVFLAIAWDRLGVGGRTAVLLAFTATAAALTTWFARKRLRGAAEALGVLATALAAFDLLGARTAGWFGSPDLDQFVAVAGALLVLAAAAAVLGLRRFGPDLIGVQVVAVLAYLASAAGWLGANEQQTAATLALLLAASIAAAVLVRHLSLWVLVIGPLAVILWSLLGLLIMGAGRTWDAHAASAATFSALWPWLVVALAVTLLARLVGLGPWAASGVWAAAVLLVLVGVLAPWVQSLNSLTLSALVVALGAAVATGVRRELVAHTGLLVVIAAVVVSVLAPGAFVLNLLERALTFGNRNGLWGEGPGRVLDPANGSLSGWVLVVLAAGGGVVHLLLVLGRARRDVPGSDRNPGQVAVDWAPVLALSLVLAGTGYGSPLLLTCLGLVAVAGLFAVADQASQPEDARHLAGAAGSFLLAAVLALLSALATLAVFGAGVLAAAGVLARSRREDLRLVAALALPVLAMLAVGAAGRLLELTDRVNALVVLVVVILAALALTHPRLPGFRGWLRPVQGIALAVAALTGLAGTEAAPESAQLLWLAIYLTVAGAGAALSGLLGHDRLAGGVGAGLLLAATWVRLVDEGVTTPEAYSLPAAAILAAAGLWLLWTTPALRTRDALSPALALALGPSALLVLDDPLSLRALLLGLACAALVAAGSLASWNAPLFFGSVVGSVVVLVELVPLGQAVPRWALIFGIGAALLGAGIQWEWMASQGRRTWGRLAALR